MQGTMHHAMHHAMRHAMHHAMRHAMHHAMHRATPQALDRHEPQNAALYFRISRPFARLAGRRPDVLQGTQVTVM